MAAHPRPVVGARVGGHAAADPSAAGDPEVASRSAPPTRRRRRARPLRWATCSGCGRASATRAAPATCIGRRSRSRPRTTGRFPPISTRCSHCRASGRTRPGPCSRSPTSATWPWSTPTSPACSPAPSGERLSAVTAQRLADRYVPRRTRLGLEPDARWTTAQSCAARRRVCDACPLVATCAWNRAGRPHPDPAVGSAGVSTRQAPYAGSDRQARGEVLRALTSGPAPRDAFRADIVDSLLATASSSRWMTGSNSPVVRFGHQIRPSHLVVT